MEGHLLNIIAYFAGLNAKVHKSGIGKLDGVAYKVYQYLLQAALICLNIGYQLFVDIVIKHNSFFNIVSPGFTYFHNRFYTIVDIKYSRYKYQFICLYF